MALRKVFGSCHVFLEPVKSAYAASVRSGHHSHSLELIAMNCVLARTNKAPKVRSERVDSLKAIDVPVQMFAYNKDDTTSDNDFRYNACVVYLPECGIFYCHRERRTKFVGTQGEHVPLDANWLRLRRHDASGISWFARGSYIKRLMSVDKDGEKHKNSVWRWTIELSPTTILEKLNLHVKHPMTTIVSRCYQCPDTHGPVLPPDFINDQDKSSMDRDELRSCYKQAFMESKSVRHGCRHYVNGFLHRKIDPLVTYVINPKDLEGNALGQNLQVLVQVDNPNKSNKVSLLRNSLIQIRYIPSIIPDHQSHLSNQLHECNADLCRKNKGTHSALHFIR